MKIKKGDKIVVIKGRDAGREGVVDRIYPKQGKILAQGINVSKKHLKKSEQTPQGGVADVPRPFSVSNVLLVCPKCKKHSKIGYKVDKGRKTRICKKCGSKV